jgi:tRNA (cytidine/uridine-2'-O-)-methyltransferase
MHTMLHVVLFEPEIPPNTGNVIRLCANAGASLHLIEPLGFTIDDAKMRRAGLDYHEYTRIHVHASLVAFHATVTPSRVFAFSTRGTQRYDQVRYADGDALLFGPETRGLPDAVLAGIASEQRVFLPLMPNNRSLNLSNAVAVAVFEAWRQRDFAGAAR